MRMLLAAGGTGGHVFPAIALAKAAKAADPSAEILFVGTPRGFERKLVPAQGFPLEILNIGGLKGKSLGDRLRSLGQLPGAFWRSFKILRRFAPETVFGIGGYLSGPILLLSALTGRKTAILEPNSVPGFSNRVLSRLVGRVFVAFQEASERLPAKKCVFTGNPIRTDILEVPPPTFAGPTRNILIFGGSQGATRLNQAMIGALPALGALKGRIRVLHQTGPREEWAVKEAYRAAGVEARVMEFVDDMAEAYRWCDVVVARAGSSILEIAAVGRPSILVPYPFAADDHQRANARVFERAGAALYLEDSECDGATLAALLSGLLDDSAKLKSMSEKALTFRHSDAARLILSELGAPAKGGHA